MSLWYGVFRLKGDMHVVPKLQSFVTLCVYVCDMDVVFCSKVTRGGRFFYRAYITLWMQYVMEISKFIGLRVHMQDEPDGSLYPSFDYRFRERIHPSVGNKMSIHPSIGNKMSAHLSIRW